MNVMEQITFAKYLDILLEIIAENADDKNEVHGGTIESKFAEKAQITPKNADVGSALEFLTEDGFIKPSTSENKKHKITFKGMRFVEEGMYTQRDLNNAAENIRLDNLQNSQKFHRIAQTWLTAILAVGTLIAAAYYLLEIIKNCSCK